MRFERTEMRSLQVARSRKLAEQLLWRELNNDWRDLKLRSEVCRDKGEEGCRDMGFTTKKESWRVEELARVGAC